ncbi:phosphotransferase [Actinacidiphila rubida]|uniref:phosphotransferase n=1 Tax=Actinacidiphila rubida TaxID=310780 RepID=UPI00389913A2
MSPLRADPAVEGSALSAAPARPAPEDAGDAFPAVRDGAPPPRDSAAHAQAAEQRPGGALPAQGTQEHRAPGSPGPDAGARQDGALPARPTHASARPAPLLRDGVVPAREGHRSTRPGPHGPGPGEREHGVIPASEGQAPVRPGAHGPGSGPQDPGSGGDRSAVDRGDGVAPAPEDQASARPIPQAPGPHAPGPGDRPAAELRDGVAPAPEGRRGDDSGAPAPAHDVLAERRDGTVVRVGGTVAKAHAVDSVPEDLAARLALAGHPRLRGIVLAPRAVGAQVGGRTVSVWPYGDPVDRRQAQAAPWEAAAGLLARLHAVPLAAVGGALPEMRGPAKVARAMARLGALPDTADAGTVRAAWRRLPPWARGQQPYRGARALCHGDWHLGQLVRHPAPDGPWQLIDVDDLGAGDPAWDLARPAMWFAAGLLPGEAWARFLAAYRAEGGTAVPAEGDPWPRLDVPARALAVQTAAIAVAKAARDGRALDPAESELLGACRRIAQLE